MTERRGRQRRQLLDDLKETRCYWQLKEEVLDRPPWRIRFGRGYGPAVRLCDERMNIEYMLLIVISPMPATLSIRTSLWTMYTLTLYTI